MNMLTSFTTLGCVLQADGSDLQTVIRARASGDAAWHRCRTPWTARNGDKRRRLRSFATTAGAALLWNSVTWTWKADLCRWLRGWENAKMWMMFSWQRPPDVGWTPWMQRAARRSDKWMAGCRLHRIHVRLLLRIWSFWLGIARGRSATHCILRHLMRHRSIQWWGNQKGMDSAHARAGVFR